jgi:ABC-type uncharacterized transport system substrate-binding protein
MTARPCPSRFTHCSIRVLAWVVGVLMCLCAGVADAEDMLIVLSSQAKPYVQAAQACEDQLEQSNIAFTRVELTSLSAQQIEAIDTRVIAIGGRAAATLAKSLPASTKLFYAMTPHPEQIGLTRRPNTSGISTETDLQEQIDLIRTGTPSTKRIGALYRSSSARSATGIAEMKSVLPVGWELIAIDLDQVKSESQGIKDLLKAKVDIVWTTPDTSTYNHSMVKALLLGSIRKKIPVFGFSQSLVEAGATFGVGIDPSHQGHQIATMVSEDQTNQHPGATPVIAINLIAAKRIGIKLSESFIRQGDVVFR